MDKLLYESLDEFVAFHIANDLDDLNESKFNDFAHKWKNKMQGKKKMLMSIADNPDNAGEILKNVFAQQVGKWPELGEYIDALDSKQKTKIARDTFIAMMTKGIKDKSVLLPIIKGEDGKVKIDLGGEIGSL